jgi:hypothetical protein
MSRDFARGPRNDKGWVPPPDVMSQAEIREWLTFLRVNYGHRHLRRLLVCPGWRKKADGREWIYPTQQVRFSHVLKRIIAGEVPEYCPRIIPRPRINFDIKTGRFTIAPPEPPRPKLPSFKQLLENPPRSIWYGGNK